MENDHFRLKDCQESIGRYSCPSWWELDICIVPTVDTSIENLNAQFSHPLLQTVLLHCQQSANQWEGHSRSIPIISHIHSRTIDIRFEKCSKGSSPFPIHKPIHDIRGHLRRLQIQGEQSRWMPQGTGCSNFQGERDAFIHPAVNCQFVQQHRLICKNIPI